MSPTSANAGVQLLDRIEQFVVDPIIAVIFTLGLFLFFWGIVEFLWQLKDGKAEGAGKQHMLWGIVGMLVMVSVYGIINLIINTFQLQDGMDVGRIQQVDPGVNFLGR